MRTLVLTAIIVNDALNTVLAEVKTLESFPVFNTDLCQK